MGTSADFARINDDGSIDYTHVSGDGYIAGAGAQLLRFYRGKEAQDRLFAGFYIEDMGEGPDEVSHLEADEIGDNPEKNFSLHECNYIFQDGEWYFRDYDDGDQLKPLTREAIFVDAAEYGFDLTDFDDIQ